MNSIPKRDIRFRDAIRIDWQRAVKEAEDFVDYISNNKGILPDDFYRELLKGAEILREVKHFYRDDDMNGYLNFLDENRYTLKGQYYGS